MSSADTIPFCGREGSVVFYRSGIFYCNVAKNHTDTRGDSPMELLPLSFLASERVILGTEHSKGVFRLENWCKKSTVAYFGFIR
jgi:hypothetical protein